MTETRSADTVHREVVLEDHLVAQLVCEQGYVERSPEDFDRDLALDREFVLRFVQETQPEEWKKLEAQYAGSAEAELALREAAPTPDLVRALFRNFEAEVRAGM